MYTASKTYSLAFLLFGILMISSCDTELDLVDQTADLPAVWGFIDPSDSVYRIRIQKTFSGKGNALDMAKIYDSYKVIVAIETTSSTEDINQIALERFVLALS